MMEVQFHLFTTRPESPIDKMQMHINYLYDMIYALTDQVRALEAKQRESEERLLL